MAEFWAGDSRCISQWEVDCADSTGHVGATPTLPGTLGCDSQAVDTGSAEEEMEGVGPQWQKGTSSEAVVRRPVQEGRRCLSNKGHHLLGSPGLGAVGIWGWITLCGGAVLHAASLTSSCQEPCLDVAFKRVSRPCQMPHGGKIVPS